MNSKTQHPLSASPASDLAVTVYGIPHCDAVKKSRHWLSDHGVAYQFHDFKKQGLDSKTLAMWMKHSGWEQVLNRKGTSWRKLDEPIREGVVDAASATVVIETNLSLIKRPVVEFVRCGRLDGFTIGFVPEQWEKKLSPLNAGSPSSK